MNGQFRIEDVSPGTYVLLINALVLAVISLLHHLKSRAASDLDEFL